MQISVDDIDRITKLVAQLYAVVVVCSGDEFWTWEREIRANYLWLATDVGEQLKDCVDALDEEK